MAILVTANDAIDFSTLVGEPTVKTSSTYHDDTYTTYAIEVSKQDVMSMDFTASSSGWVHWHTLVNGNSSTFPLANTPIATITGNSGGNFFRVMQDTDKSLTEGTDFPIFFQRWDGAAWVKVGPDVPEDVKVYIDIEFKIDPAVGFFIVYTNGQEIGRFDGKTDHSGTTLDNVTFLGRTTSGGDNDFTTISQLIVTSSEITIDMRLATLDIDGEGATSAWTGTFTDINDQDFDINQKITSGTADEVSTYTVTGLSAGVLASTFLNILSVNVHHYIRDNTGAPTSVQQVVRPLSTDFFSPTDSTIGSGYELSIHRFTTNPDTATNWLLTEIAALEIGAKSIT